MKTVRELYRKLNNDNEIPTIDGQGNFTAEEMIWFAEQAVKLFAIPDMKQYLKNLTSDERLNLLDGYCKHCGNYDADTLMGCQCWNDE